MKNQYFADINDYRKYGLLRHLLSGSQFRIGICWMLTPDDNNNDGQKLRYLTQPEKWRKYDPGSFDSLSKCVLDKSERAVKWMEANELLPNALYMAEIIKDNIRERKAYFEKISSFFKNCDVVFFDPDNGIETSSKAKGAKNSNKYIYWDELRETFKNWQSLIVYQHFIRVNRKSFIDKIALRLCDELVAETVISLSTSHVVFFLIPQPSHLDYFQRRCIAISSIWHTEIRMDQHVVTMMRNNHDT